MKKIINLTILFATLLSLSFIPATSVSAAKKVTLTYYTNNGYFKAKLNRNKKKINLKNKINKKRGYAPAVRRDGYVFDGWYTKKKKGIKYSSSTIITKKQKLYPHWLKKYKISTNYFIPVGITFLNISEYEPYWGKLKILKKKKIATYDYEYTLKNHKGDLFYLTTDIHSIDDNDNFTYEYYYFNMECKLKNIINIKKSMNYKKFLKRLGVTAYNYDSSNNYLDFVCCKTHFTDDTYDTDMVWSMYLDDENQVSPNTVVSFDPNDDWKPYF